MTEMTENSRTEYKRGLTYGVSEMDFFNGCSVPRNKEIMRVFLDLELLGYSQRTGNFKKALDSLLTHNLIEYTIAKKINSRLQKYRLTARGKSLVTSIQQDPNNASE